MTAVIKDKRYWKSGSGSGSGGSSNGLECSNCGKKGHKHKSCYNPIMSYGIICYRQKDSRVEYLLIQRKHSIAYIDFVRGKYKLENINFLDILFSGMTHEEKNKLKEWSFEKIWNDLWKYGSASENHGYEKKNSEIKFNKLKKGVINVSNGREINISNLIEDNISINKNLEWGFPKGRRNTKEGDLDCAFREFTEETNYVREICEYNESFPKFTEEFIGTNRIAYRYIYYLCEMKDIEKDAQIDTNNYNQCSEIGGIKWMTFEEAIHHIGKKNRAKIGVLQKANVFLTNG